MKPKLGRQWAGEASSWPQDLPVHPLPVLGPGRETLLLLFTSVPHAAKFDSSKSELEVSARGARLASSLQTMIPGGGVGCGGGEGGGKVLIYGDSWHFPVWVPTAL